MIFAAVRTRGSRWDDTLPLEGQREWNAHAAFMDALYTEGVCLFAGPLDGTRDALVILRARDLAQARAMLDVDPWTGSGLLTLSRLDPWILRLGSELL